MLRIAVVEDEEVYQKQLIEFLERFQQEKEMPLDIEIYTDGDEFINKYDAQFDIILMDIQMPLMDGMSAAEEIRKIDSKVIIIFITNMAQYAIKGYAVDAMDYVLKPITYFSFSERLDKATKKLRKRETHYLTVKVTNGYIRLEVSDIYYIESQGHKLIIYTKDGEIESSGAMKDLENKLSDYGFFRLHRGYFVNLSHVEGINDSCALVKGDEIPISRAKRKNFMKSLADHGEV
ncbi:DNA-binding LytR/AlgR family response regulator [Natronobacillus azotifigens]|uniref:LytTR family DNA-binding domain-containing protein n=1 Tax=Natronobacillus azotifigens TaxID=472978 RepID=A0A9J6RCF3_9BACI|nr:LytTR family DNA-binding domain-containing protein [Natronobacillus azotifigens]MCZ0703223.1 LytTR family DNA-binding domain-containing protein [Natronobacillus azotifigens]